MKVLCLFSLKDGIGVLLEEDYEKEADLYLKGKENLEDSLRLAPDELGNLCLFVNDIGINLENKILSSLLKNPHLYFLFKRKDSSFVEESIKIELNRDDLLRLEGMLLYTLSLKQ
ncbi:MAG: hypothetical protein QXW80_04915 [Candidatus Micrarchaeia archaeon]